MVIHDIVKRYQGGQEIFRRRSISLLIAEIEQKQAEVTQLKEERDALRPEVREFAALMESKLRQNDHKGGWQDESIAWLFSRLVGEMQELADAIDYKPADIPDEAVDAANFSMFIWDVYRKGSEQ